METKACPLLQSNIPFDFNFEVKAFLKYICWINPATFTIKYLLAAFVIFSAVKLFKDNTIMYSIQTHFYVDS